MDWKLACYLELHKRKYGTELDYRLTAMELYELGADDITVLKFQEWMDNKQIGG